MVRRGAFQAGRRSPPGHRSRGMLPTAPLAILPYPIRRRMSSPRGGPAPRPRQLWMSVPSRVGRLGRRTAMLAGAGQALRDEVW